MKNNLTYIAITLSFCMMLLGCLTEKKAVKQIARISMKQEQVLLSECGKRYPPIDSIWEKETFIEGEPVVFTDTVTVDCPENNLPNASNGTIRKVKIPIASKVRVDTVVKTKFQQVENTAIIEANRKQINKLENENIEDKHAKKVWMIVAAIGWGFFLLGFVVKWLKGILAKWFTIKIF